MTKYSAGGLIRGGMRHTPRPRERLYMSDGPVYEWTEHGWQLLPDAPNPLADARRPGTTAGVEAVTANEDGRTSGEQNAEGFGVFLAALGLLALIAVCVTAVVGAETATVWLAVVTCVLMLVATPLIVVPNSRRLRRAVADLGSRSS